MSNLIDLVPALKRTVAAPGEFTTVYPNSTDPDVLGYLEDGFAEAQFDGFFTASFGGTAYTLDTVAGTVTPDLTNPQNALVVIYAATRLVTAQVLNLKNRQRFAAKGADFETEQSPNVLTSLLKQFQDRKAQLIQKALYSGPAAAFHMADGYFLAATDRYLFAGDFYLSGYYDPAGF